MKKSIYIAIASMLSVTALASACTNEKPNAQSNAPHNIQTLSATASDSSNTPMLAITELSADPMQIEFASTESADQVVRDTSDVFEFVEIHNYGNVTINLKEYALQHTVDTKVYQDEFLFEEGNDGLLEAGQTCVIFIYNTASYAYGPNGEYSIKYDTAENLAKAWDTFNTFYGISVPVENRVMALVADTSGNAISGASALATKGDCSVAIVKKENGSVLAEAEYTVATKGLSHNYVFSETLGLGKLLCVNGVSPYRLLREQDPNYSASYDFSGEEIRLVNYNLLFTGYVFSARASCFADFLNTYSPDVVCLQEIAIEWYDYLHTVLPALGYTYVEVQVQTDTGVVPTYHSDSTNPIIYKTDKFDLVATGGTFVSEDGTSTGKKWDSVNRNRTINYAVLESKASSNQFTVLSTHGILTGDNAKIQHGNMAKNLANQLMEQYNCPSYILGDMNMDEGSKYYQNMVSNTGYADSKYIAKNSSYRLTGALFGKTPYGATDKVNPWNQEPTTIDYVFVPNGTQVKNYRVVDDAYYNAEFAAAYSDRDCHISDHSAVLVDLYI